MDTHWFLEQLVLAPQPTLALLPQWSNEEIQPVIDELKRRSDHLRGANPAQALHCADLMSQIGEAAGNVQWRGLAMMLQGQIYGDKQPAQGWNVLAQAEAVFQEVGDVVGQARTWIGRVKLAIACDQIAVAQAKAEEARRIFLAHGQLGLLTRLDNNLAVMYSELGRYREAIGLQKQTLTRADQLSEDDQALLDHVRSDLGTNLMRLGDGSAARQVLELASRSFSERQQPIYQAITDLSLAYIFMGQGHYRQALKLQHQARTLLPADSDPSVAAWITLDLADCYLLLNRYDHALALAKQAQTEFQTLGNTHYAALAALTIATVLARLNSFQEAQQVLEMADASFRHNEAIGWSATLHIRRGYIALQHYKQQRQLDAEQSPSDQLAAAQLSADLAFQSLEALAYPLEYTASLLLQGQIAFEMQAYERATSYARQAAAYARRYHVPTLHYSAYLLLGHIARADHQVARAARCYRTAIAIVDRVQRGLTISLRPDFLEDKGEALRSLMSLILREQQHSPDPEAVFSVLEQAKLHVLLDYTTNREQLRWVDRAGIDGLGDAFNRLREEYRWLQQATRAQAFDPKTLIEPSEQETLRRQLRQCEYEIRRVIEQLHVSGQLETPGHPFRLPSLEDIQRHLDPTTLVIEFYQAEQEWWAFLVDRDTLQLKALGKASQQLEEQVKRLLFSMRNADQDDVFDAWSINDIKTQLRALYQVLLAPLQTGKEYTRLVFVPYGILHHVPFNVLYTGRQYLIEAYEIVVWPSAGWATQSAPSPQYGARVLGHIGDEQAPLRGVVEETRAIIDLFGGTLHLNEQARREVLSMPPQQILHIAAHGEHRLDQPTLSCIYLADGPLLADDLLQVDLSYELVTLSACQSGQTKITASDELIGLSRAALYAGAGAVVTSLWRVPDSMTAILMHWFYTALRRGRTKSAALRLAQRQLRRTRRHFGGAEAHPACWGAFQLIGNVAPLTDGDDRYGGTHERRTE